MCLKIVTVYFMLNINKIYIIVLFYQDNSVFILERKSAEAVN